MSIDTMAAYAKEKYFSKLNLCYKQDSFWMRLIGNIMFFNKDFMKSYFTTINDTIYLPNKDFIQKIPISTQITLIHELTHVYDNHRLTKVLFNFLYLSPQCLFLLTLPLCIFFGWWGLLALLFLAPIPSLGRSYLEYRAYCTSMYCTVKVNQKFGFTSMIETSKVFYIKQFTGPNYLFMFPFNSYITNKFNNALAKINNGERPYEDKKLFNMIDDLLTKIEG